MFVDFEPSNYYLILFKDYVNTGPFMGEAKYLPTVDRKVIKFSKIIIIITHSFQFPHMIISLLMSKF